MISQENIKKMQEALRKKYNGSSWNKGIKQWEGKKHPMLGKKHTFESREKMCYSKIGKHYSPNTEFKKGHSYNKGKHSKNEFTKERIKEMWSNPEFRERATMNILKGLIKRPTSLEKKMIEIIEKNNLPYKYVGNGSFLIGFKNPDFVNVNGQKICMEVANFYHHKGNWEKNRIEHFAKYGWKTIVIWENEFDNENIILEKIGGMISSGS